MRVNKFRLQESEQIRDEIIDKFDEAPRGERRPRTPARPPAVMALTCIFHGFL